MFQDLNSHNDSDRDDESAAAVEIVLVQLCEEEKQPERNKKRMLPCGAATKRRRQYHSLTVCIVQRRDYKKYPSKNVLRPVKDNESNCLSFKAD